MIAVAAAMMVMWDGGLQAQETGVSRKWQYLGGKAVRDGMDEQRTPPERLPASIARGASQLNPGEPIWLQVGKSRVIQLPQPIKRVSIGDPEMAGVVVLGPRTVMLNAKELPKTLTADRGARSVRGSELSQLLTRTLTPTPRLAETTFAIWYGREDNPDVHTLTIADFIDRQVMIDVIVAELDRAKFEEWGIDIRVERSAFLMSFFNGGGVGPSPGEAASLLPALGGAALPIGTSADGPIFGFQAPKEGVSGLVQAMERDGLIKIIARPRLVAMSGQNALFQVGGEIPIRIATGFATDVEFKPFGTIINFVPRVSEEGEIILTVTPEVSQPDFNSLVEGIPTFRTRRASTSTRLRSGQTFIIGGLTQTILRRTVSGVPYLMDIPGLGWVFRQTRYDDDVTEMMVVTTPYLVDPLPAGTQVALPTDRRTPRRPPNPY